MYLLLNNYLIIPLILYGIEFKYVFNHTLLIIIYIDNLIILL